MELYEAKVLPSRCAGLKTQVEAEVLSPMSHRSRPPSKAYPVHHRAKLLRKQIAERHEDGLPEVQGEAGHKSELQEHWGESNQRSRRATRNQSQIVRVG